MALFVSRRERRLWLCTAGAVAGTYATLGLAGVLPGLLDDQGLGAVLFSVAMLLVGATVVVQGLRKRSSGLEIGVVLGVAAVYLMLFLRLSLAERTHLIEYGVVASFIYEAIRERKTHGGRVPLPALTAILLTGLIGTFDELIQLFVPGRVFDPIDIWFNVLAGLMTVAARVAVERAKRRRISLPRGSGERE